MAIFVDSRIMAVSLDGRQPEFARHSVTLPDDGAVSVFACAHERYRCISPTARRLEYLIGPDVEKLLALASRTEMLFCILKSLT